MSIIKQIQNRRRQLDEVSKALIGRYLKKAADKIVDHSYDMGAAAQHGDGADAYDSARKKASKRLCGVKLATDKLQKEEIEQIDELSRSKITDYREKAYADAGVHNDAIAKSAFHATHAHVSGEPELEDKFSKDIDKHARKYTNRVHGIVKSTKILKSTKGLQKDGTIDAKFHREEVEKSATRQNIEAILEDGIKKKGRPRKARHEDGEIVNDPKA